MRASGCAPSPLSRNCRIYSRGCDNWRNIPHMTDPTDVPDRLLLAYQNQEFLDTPDARPLRMLSEYLYPLSHFRKEKVSDTIVFFGSARTFEASASGRYYNEARELAHRITEWSVNLE